MISRYTGGVLEADRIAVIGDLHGRYSNLDNDYLEQSSSDLVLFVGDLGSGTLNNGLEMIKTISRLRVPGLLLPGNNDAPHLAALAAELAFQSGKSELFRLMGPTARKGVTPCGLSLHELSTRHGGVSLIAARPCAMGGSECSFADILRRTHHIGTLDESLSKMKELVEQAAHDTVLFLAHNGPFGLGGEPDDLWGRDFTLKHHPHAPRDWGDTDLTAAIHHARSVGKRVIGVIAGHMHRSEHQPRPLFAQRRETTYVNSAQVPRIMLMNDQEHHHYVEVEIDLRAEVALRVQERWVVPVASPPSSQY